MPGEICRRCGRRLISSESIERGYGKTCYENKRFEERYKVYKETMFHMSKEISNKIDLLINKYGGLRKAARVLNIDPGYLSRLRSGKKKNPGKNILRKLGLEKEIIYSEKEVK